MCIGIRRDRLSWTRPGQAGETRSQSVAIDVPGGDVSQASPDFARDLGAIAQQSAGGGRVEVVLADEMARYWLMDPPSGTASLEELRHVALARCSQLFDQDVDAWVVAADWQASSPFVCVAVPGWIVSAISKVFGTRARIQTALGVLLGSAAHLLPKEGWVCVTGPRQVTLLRTQAGLTCSLRAVACEDGLRGEAQLRKSSMELRRQSLRERSSIKTPVAWLDLMGSPAATGSVDGIVFDPVVPPWISRKGSASQEASEVEIAAWMAFPRNGGV